MCTTGVIVVVMTSMVYLTDSPAFVSIQPLKFLVFFCVFFSFSHSIIRLFISSKSIISLLRCLPTNYHCSKSLGIYSIQKKGTTIFRHKADHKIIDPLQPSVPFSQTAWKLMDDIICGMVLLHCSRLIPAGPGPYQHGSDVPQ